MRLKDYEKDILKKYFYKYFNGEIYLFGSRVDDTKIGGDIDLYLKVDNKENLFERKLKFLASVKKEIGERRIDVVFNKDNNRLIEKEAQKWGIKL